MNVALGLHNGIVLTKAGGLGACLPGILLKLGSQIEFVAILITNRPAVGSCSLIKDILEQALSY